MNKVNMIHEEGCRCCEACRKDTAALFAMENAVNHSLEYAPDVEEADRAFDAEFPRGYGK